MTSSGSTRHSWARSRAGSWLRRPRRSRRRGLVAQRQRRTIVKLARLVPPAPRPRRAASAAHDFEAGPLGPAGGAGDEAVAALPKLLLAHASGEAEAVLARHACDREAALDGDEARAPACLAVLPARLDAPAVHAPAGACALHGEPDVDGLAESERRGRADRALPPRGRLDAPAASRGRKRA